MRPKVATMRATRKRKGKKRPKRAEASGAKLTPSRKAEQKR